METTTAPAISADNPMDFLQDAAKHGINRRSGSTRSYPLRVDHYDLDKNQVVGTDLSTGERKAVMLTSDSKAPPLSDFAKDPATTKKKATAPGGILFIKNAYTKDGVDHAYYIETGSKSADPKHGQVLTGMINAGELFQYVKQNGERGEGRVIQLIDHSAVAVVNDFNKLQEVVGRAMTSQQFGEANGSPMALVQLASDDPTGIAPGITISVWKGETIDDAITRSFKEPLIEHYIRTALEQEGVPLHARVMAGQSFFASSTYNQTFDGNGLDPVLRTPGGTPGWAEGAIFLYPNNVNDPRDGHVVSKTLTTKPYSQIKNGAVDLQELHPKTTTTVLSPADTEKQAQTSQDKPVAENVDGSLSSHFNKDQALADMRDALNAPEAGEGAAKPKGPSMG